MVPGAMANRVGFTDAMTVPCAATSRTKCPLATVTIWSRSAEMTWLELDHARISQPTTRARRMTLVADTCTQRCRYHGRLGVATVVSCFSVPRTVAAVFSSAIFMAGLAVHVVCQLLVPINSGTYGVLE